MWTYKLFSPWRFINNNQTRRLIMNTKILKVFGLLIIGLFLVTACGPLSSQIVRGSGNAVTENREVSGFDSVSHTGIGRVIITQGDKGSLTIEADDNLMEYITSEVKSGTLELGFAENVRFESTSSITFTVGAKDIVELSSTGTGSIEIDELGADNLNISTSGTGSVSIGSLTTTDLVVNAKGTGDIKLAGNVESQEITRVGTGDYDAADLESKTAKVEATGTGSVVIWVLDALDVEITGTSEVSYYGSPDVTQKVTGNGSLTSLGDK
jgi:hypothetical protein